MPHQTWNKSSVITQAALLTAIGILIPLLMPIKIIIGPASYTLASHVPIMLAMFISPMVASIVAIGTALGFFLAGFPIVIVLRAASHLLFAYYGANKLISISTVNFNVFNIIINLFHAVAEVIVVTAITSLQFDLHYFYTVVLLVGLGTLIHGIIDFYLAHLLAHSINKHKLVFPNHLKINEVSHEI
ncbi:hypothetical protein HZY91_06455 [Facklamia sp. DSM 111018]|uniref:Niacin transporter NiaX n=1 Tax=Facklamia lactis TaxID=2749967 RepID=A0ABS0LT68_9LACT|nr:hypothetical protein [Facklamia lactis]MBG9980722.1 hypothetical protein [Facklamia lactis]MBG9986536.1 hypothetical protein [Facklamia lactis]